MKNGNENQEYEFLSNFLKDQITTQKKRTNQNTKTQDKKADQQSVMSKTSKYNNQLIEKMSREIQDMKQGRKSESQLEKLKSLQNTFLS